MAESLHVFIQGNQLEERIAKLADKPLVIAECGFGFGLNFLLTCETFCQLAPENGRLHFLSCENHPVLQKDLQRYYKKLPSALQSIADNLLNIYPQQGRGFHRLKFQFQSHHIILDLLFDEAINAFENLSVPPAGGIDAWYLDGHAPSKNNEMWDIRLCKTIARLSKPGNTTLATYSVAGFIRRNLQQAGFSVSKAPGFGKKRHMLTASLEKESNSDDKALLSWKTPWSEAKQKIKTIGIIGAGLAGCASANALAARGYQITLIEKNPDIANGASGNNRGIVHFNPGREINAATSFRLHAFNYAVRHYQSLSQNISQSNQFSWNPCGLLQIAISAQEKSEQDDLIARGLYDPQLIFPVTSEQASEIANTSINYSGLYFPSAASLDPRAVCKAWISHENISLLISHDVQDIEYQNKQWQVKMGVNGSNESQAFDALVICNNQDAIRFCEKNDYPLISNHGQTTIFPVNVKKQELESLKTILRHKGYIIPWKTNTNDMLTIGGSFKQGEHKSEPTEITIENSALKKLNLQLIKNISLPIYAILDKHFMDEDVLFRTGTRSTTPDYQPLAGPVESSNESMKIFEDYQRNAKNEVYATARYQPGLYINAGYGSSGLTTTPLLAEYLASLISNEILPLGKEEISAVLPLRFLIRDLKKQNRK